MRTTVKVRRETLEKNPDSVALKTLFNHADTYFKKQFGPEAKNISELKVREVIGTLLPEMTMGGIPCVHFGEKLDFFIPVKGNRSPSYTLLNPSFYEIILDATK